MATTRIDAALSTIAAQDAELSKLRAMVKRAGKAQPKAAEQQVNPYTANRKARRALAASMRARGQAITPATWAKAKKAAGIVPVKSR